MTSPSSRPVTMVLFMSADPRQWTEDHVREWLTWTVNEFTLKNVDFHKFCMNGASLCALGKERFLDLAPDFVGDILWEHLEMLQKGELETSSKLNLCVVSTINIAFSCNVAYVVFSLMCQHFLPYRRHKAFPNQRLDLHLPGIPLYLRLLCQ